MILEDYPPPISEEARAMLDRLVVLYDGLEALDEFGYPTEELKQRWKELFDELTLFKEKEKAHEKGAPDG